MAAIPTTPSAGWSSRVLSHVGGPKTFKKIGVDAGLASLFAIGAWLTSDSGPLKDADDNTKRLVHLAFGVPMMAKLEVPELMATWKEREIPDFIMHGLTTAIATLGAGTNDRDMIVSAAMLATLFSMAGHLEEGIQSKSQEGIKAMEALVPETAHLHATNKTVDVSRVKVGDHVLVKAGQTVPVDGIAHEIHVNGKHTSLGAIRMPTALDGEGRQMAVTTAGKVPQGAVAADGTQLVVEAKALAHDSSISRNIKYLEEAENMPGKTAHGISSNIKNIYVPIMIAAVAAEFAWSYYNHKKKHDERTQAMKDHKDGKPLDRELFDTCEHDKNKKQDKKKAKKGHEEEGEESLIMDKEHWDKEHRARTPIDHARKSVKRSAELAIKMAPCAIMASLLVIPFIKNALASSHGVMIREDAALEKLKGVTHVLTDIRGTLTKGISEFKGIHLWDHASGSLKAAEKEAGHQLLGLMGKAETASTHEIANSIREAAARAGHNLELATGEQAALNITKGVSGTFADGHQITIGGKKMFTEKGHELPEALIKAAEQHGGDLTFFRHQQGEDVRYGIAQFQDRLREGAKDAIHGLVKDGKKVVMVTGMPAQSAQKIMEDLEIHTLPEGAVSLRADCAPTAEAGKLGKDEVVKEFAKGNNMIAAIGDAENDAAFMAAAKKAGGVSMAISSTGAAATKENASMVIEGMHQLPDLIKLSRNMSHALWLNVGAAASWMGLLIGSHYAGYHMKTQTASVLHEAPTFLLTLASLGQSMRLTGQFANLGR